MKTHHVLWVYLLVALSLHQHLDRALGADGDASQLVGAELLERGSTDPRYQRWIDSYGGDDFATTVTEVLALADRTGPTLMPADEAAARAHFVTTARYEWMFFDSAHRREEWPV